MLLSAYSTVGYVVVAGYSPIDAIFMTVITISTVGYGEPRTLTGAGELFSISVIVIGVGGFLYTFGLLVDIISSGEWRRYRTVQRMQHSIDRLNGHTIVCGYGRSGREVAEYLAEMESPFVIVELDPDRLEEADRRGHPHLIGDATSDQVLRAAGISRARGLVSAVDSDERAVYITLSARSLNPEIFVVARASFQESEAKLTLAGADRVISPYALSGRRMASLVVRPEVIDVLDVRSRPGEPPMRVEEFQASAPSTIGALQASGASLLALRSSGGATAVGPTTEAPVAPGDLVIAMGTAVQLHQLALTLQRQ